MLTVTEQDALARRRIAEETGSSFFVEAAAGSGKTTSLVARMTAMVAGGIDVSEICAITFTKAAANEFYSRFRRKLMEHSRSETDPVRRKRYADALENIDLCFMGTIDSFANTLLHEHPLDADMPSETAVCAGSEAVGDYLAEYARIKHGAYGEALQKKYELFRSVQPHADDVFASCISTFTERREADFQYPQPDDTDTDAAFTDWKYRLILTLQQLSTHPEYVSGVKDSQSTLKQLPRYISVLRGKWNNRIGEAAETLGKLDGLRLGKDSKRQIYTPESVGAELPGIFEYHEGARESYYFLSTKASEVYRKLTALRYAATVDFLVCAAREIASEMRRKGRMTFHDALLTLRDTLRDDARSGGRLIRHIAKRHRYYLVDEFQDTDPLQAEIVFYLAAQEPVPDWTACVPRPGSLFIVGDPKQSIYRFRGADVSSFLRVRSIFSQGAGEVLTLSRNFRSTAKMRRRFNAVFPALLTEAEGEQSAFYPIPVDDSEADTVFSGIYTYPVTVSKGGRSLADDAMRVTGVIRRLIGNPAVRMKDGNPPKFSDIMVISYRKKQTAEIAKQLTAAGIPVRVEGKTDFSDSGALRAAIRILAAAAMPRDSMSVFRALTSEVFCIPEETVRQFCSIGGRLYLFAEQEETLAQFPALQSAFAQLRQYASAAAGTDSAALLAVISDGSRLFAKTGSAALEYYCYALELLRKAERDGTVISHADAAAFLQALLEGSGEERCVSLSPDENRVHIANLHKVKGLEAPIVILADPYAEIHEPALRVVHEPGRTACRIFRLSSALQTVAETDLYPEELEQERICADAERLRLLYVAATRAENILIIGDSRKESGERLGKNPWSAFLEQAEGCMDACIPENPAAIPEPVIRTDGDALYDAAAEQSVLRDQSVTEPTYAIVRPSRIRLKPVTADDAEDAPQEEPLDRNAALTGTLVHRLMEYMVSGGVPKDGDALISAILREFDAEEAVYAPLLRGVLGTVTHGGYPQSDGTPADLLAELRGADEVCCEVPFCQQRGSEIVSGVIDLLYRKDGAWHIVDYKTNAERAHLAEKYAAQLAAYREAVRAIIGAEADARIYHIDV
ncbi:MAG: UvrD-helicase domain-containing protein [Oscillospiraceae bacterium]|nr:UvrD-helicase domain-containing protein [Oscillospiraceae bacterium]